MANEPTPRVLIASRQSDLAKIQAYMVADALRAAWPGLEVGHHFRESLGDINLTDPLWKIPERGVFTEDFVQGLARGEFDCVVHSWKDLPTENRPGAEIVATLPRADARDLVLLRRDLPEGGDWKILSSSPRRAHNLQGFFEIFLPVKPASVEFKSVRGNVPRRIEKLTEGEGDGLILAKAALDRLLDDRYAEFAPTREKLQRWLQNFWIIALPLELNPPAAAQGALAIEIRSDRADLRQIFAPLNHAPTFEAVHWERQRLSDHGGGCHLKIGLLQTRWAPDSPLRLTIERGQTPAGVDFSHRGAFGLTRAPAPVGPVASLRTEDLFETASIPVRGVSDDPSAAADPLAFVKSAPVRLAHSRALTTEIAALLKSRGPKDPWVWASGLESWKKLAAQGIWVRGCDEGLGTESGLSRGLDRLMRVNAGRSSDRTSPLWARVSHEDRAGGLGDDERLIATYRLTPKAPTAATLETLKNAVAFFWRSAALYKEAIKHVPSLKEKDHACGPGATRQVLEHDLGRSLEDRLFFNELDWKTWVETSSKG